jgi:O-antigen/teichoic acid export membrane protein
VTPAVATTPSRTLGNAAVYSVANAVPRLLTFLFLPIYTRALSPAEYGRLSLILIIAVAASYLFASGLDVAIMRIYFRVGDQAARRRFVHSLWLAGLAVSGIGTATLLFAASIFIGSHGTVRFQDLALGLAGATVLVAGTTIPQSILRAEQRRSAYLQLSLVNAGLTSALTLFLVVGLRLGTTGWLTAILIANAATLIFASLLVGWRPPVPFDKASVKRAFGMGIPLIPHALAQWSLLLADRGVLAGIVSTTQLGLYSLAAAMSTPALILVQSINQGFATSYADPARLVGDEDSIGETTTLHSILVFWVSLVVALLGPCAIGLLTAPAFRSAGPLVPWLALGYLFLGLYYIPMSGLSLGLGNTRLIWVFGVAAAAINLGLVLFLVPSYGLTGAAIASAVGYLALLLSMFGYAMFRKAPLAYRWRRLVATAGTTAIVSAVALITTSDTNATDLVARAAWCAVGIVAIGLAGGLRPRALLVLVPLRRDA